MKRRVLSRFTMVIALCLSILMSLLPVTVFAAGLTIYESGPQTAIDQNVTTSVSEWSLKANATALPNNNGVPSNVSMVFDYTDADDYFYANFSAADATSLSGVYQVSGGTITKLLGYATRISPNQTNSIEVRKKGTDIKLYMNGTYLVKATGVLTNNMKMGVASISGNANFDTVTFKTTATVTLNPTPVTTGVPTPVTDPNQSLPVSAEPMMTDNTLREVPVSNSDQLKAALASAQPGDKIELADGTYTGSTLAGNYTGSFAITRSGTMTNPITLTGSSNAVIDGNGTGGHYGLYLYGANYWNITGLTVNNASKGIVLDGSSNDFIDNVTVSNTGQEGVHFRSFSRYDVLKNSTVSNTGLRSPQYGEGVYIGSANSNWATYSNGQPDTSDRNVIYGNTLSTITAEPIDVKEGTTGGHFANNSFDGSAISGQNSADSWMDVKGNYNLIENNIGVNTLQDGYQVHVAYAGWGADNLFRNNISQVNAPGYGFNLVNGAMGQGNVVDCSNVVTGAAMGFADVPCTQE